MALMHNEAFIDGQNLNYSTKRSSQPWQIDLAQFRVYLQQKYHVENAYYFMGYKIKKHAKLYKLIEESGYILSFRYHSEEMKTQKKGNVDTDIVFNMMRKIADKEKLNGMILVSGDGDYFQTVKYLVQNGKFIRLLAPDKDRMSSLYRTLGLRYYAFLSQDEIKKRIEIKKAGPA